MSMRRLEPETILSFDEAQRIVLEATPRIATESVELDCAYGRVLAQTITARDSIPPFDASMVDGFAVRSEDVSSASASSPVELAIAAENHAGSAP